MERGGGEEGQSGAAAAHDNNQRRCGAGRSRGLGWPRAGHHGSRSPGPVGRHPQAAPEEQTPRRGLRAGGARSSGKCSPVALLLPPTAGARELGIPGWRQRLGEPVPGLQEGWFPAQTPPIVLVGTSDLHGLPFPGYRWLGPWEPDGHTANEVSYCARRGLREGRWCWVSLTSKHNPVAALPGAEGRCRGGWSPIPYSEESRRVVEIGT